MQPNPTDRARRVQAAADDWHDADPAIKDAVTDGVIRDLDNTPAVASGTMWPAFIVCVSMLGVLAVYAYRMTF